MIDDISLFHAHILLGWCSYLFHDLETRAKDFIEGLFLLSVKLILIHRLIFLILLVNSTPDSCVGNVFNMGIKGNQFLVPKVGGSQLEGELLLGLVKFEIINSMTAALYLASKRDLHTIQRERSS